MRRVNSGSAIGILAASLALTACASFPIPYEVDLKAQLSAAETTGQVETPVKTGEVEELELYLPTDEGQCLDFADAAPGATVQSAQLHWRVDATYEGPELTGKLQARAHAAKAGDDVFHPSHTLGPVFTIDLGRSKTRLAGTAVLNPTQLEAINEREVCWGVAVTGTDIAALEDGTAKINYEIEELRLRITFSVL